MNSTTFDLEFRHRLSDLMRLRRDVRHFQSKPISNALLDQLAVAIRWAPSVGLSEPWRCVLVESTERRANIVQEFEATNHKAADLYIDAQDKLDQYRQLKLSGLKEAPVHLAVFASASPSQGSGLGRQTMPESVEYSVVAAIQNLWLTARAEGIGMGWVSILRPERINDILDIDPTWKLVAYLCLGYPERTDDEVPELERVGWETRSKTDELWIRR
jgi:5,6-dimethylbenzimidazole synthase